MNSRITISPPADLPAGGIGTHESKNRVKPRTVLYPLAHGGICWPLDDSGIEVELCPPPPANPSPLLPWPKLGLSSEFKAENLGIPYLKGAESNGTGPTTHLNPYTTEPENTQSGLVHSNL